MNKKMVITVIVFLALIGLAFYKINSRHVVGVAATGTIEVTRADITPKTSGYLTGLTIEAGDRVNPGQIIVAIDRPDLAANVAANAAALAKAAVQLKDMEAGARSQELDESRSSLASARSVYDNAKDDLVRYETLYQQNAISKQSLDAARSAADVAYQSFQAASSRLSLLQEGNRPDEIAAARLEVERSQAVLDASRVLLNDTVVTSPLNGLILTKNYENGEYVNAGSAIATVADMDDCWVKIYIPSTQLGLITVGQTAQVKIDSYPDRTFSGQIKEISQSSEYTPRQSLSQNERANMVFKVKVKVDNGGGLLKPGMPADVVIK